ncbi:X-ray repair cross-complementing protein 5 [Borealophlyctis nickersoniae]|nr:X-ray repair cross-complementing protein 5 [Borealophlyctis nickersoniae]
MANKEATVIILDVSPSMRKHKDEYGQTSQDKACQAIFKILQPKLIAGRKTDLIALLLVGTAETHNVLAQDGQYENISAYDGPVEEDKYLYMPDMDLMKFVDAGAEKGEAVGDVMDGIIVALHMLDLHCKKLKWTKKVYLFTNADNVIDHEGADAVVEKAKEMDVQFSLMGYEFDDAERGVKYENKSKLKLRMKKANEEFLRTFTAHLDGQFFEGSEAAEALERFRSKQVKPVTLFRENLTLGDPEAHPDACLQIPVWAYNKTTELKLPSAKKWSALSEQIPEGERQPATYGGVDMNRTYKLAQLDADAGGDGKDDDEEIDEEETIKAYRYGKTLVPFSRMDEEQMKLGTEKGMSILGFVKLEQVPRHAFMANVLAVIPEPDNPRAGRMFNALMAALDTKASGAIVRYVRTRDAGPKIGVLAPSPKGWGLFAQLPFAEDVRLYSFPPLDHLVAAAGITSSSATVSTMSQFGSMISTASRASGKKSKLDARTGTPEETVQRLDAFIDAMDLMEPEHERENLDDPRDDLYFKPKDVFNPGYQRLYQCIAHRALHPDDSSLPPMNPKILEGISPLPEMVEKAADAAQKLKEAFTITKVEKSTVSSKRAWANRAAAAAAADRLDADEVLNQGGEDAEAPAAKKVKFENGEGEFSGDMSMRQLTERKVDKVGTVDPVSDFNAMLSRRDLDVVSIAVEQMCDVIFKLVTESFGDQLYAKAMDCIVALRAGCAREDESEAFNTWIRELKRNLTTGPHTRHQKFWEGVVDKGITLITKDEAGDSEVDKAEAEEFLKSDQALPESAPTHEAEEEDEEDLLDMMD